MFALRVTLAVLISFGFSPGDYLNIIDILNDLTEASWIAGPDKLALRQAVRDRRCIALDLLEVAIDTVVGLTEICLVVLVDRMLFVQLHAVATFFVEVVIFSSFTDMLMRSTLVILIAGHLILCGNFLHRVLIAVVLHAFFAVLGALLLSYMLLLVAVELLLIILEFFFLAFFLCFLLFAHHHHDTTVFILVHELVFLNHALQMLEYHLARQEAANQCLHLDKRAQEPLLVLVGLLILLFLIFFDPVLV